MIKLLRVRQWVKNIFALGPLLLSGKVFNFSDLLEASFSFVLLCFAASAVYIVNDFWDRASDKRHPLKSKTRALASGEVSPWQGFVLLGFLYFVLSVGLWFRPSLILGIGAYLVLNLCYTFYFKNIPVIDLFSIASGFVLRVFVGGEAIGVPLSFWVLVTSFSLALFLACIKRRQDLFFQADRHYCVSTLNRYALISSTGVVLFYSLFVISTRAQLAITIPFVLFGVFRCWFLIEAKEQEEGSPIDLLWGDWPMIVNLVLWGIFSAGVALS